MALVGARLIQLQTSQHAWLSARARAQQQGELKAGPVRGLILDRAGRELARSIDADSFFADPTAIADVDRAAARLAPLLGADAAALAARLK
ncbi:MAG: stage V sporulation protein D, partial [Pyrinomonadaceae bacterium]